jgi:hypothetical protein|tara:strand:+ start:457 stop:939 length:483 start_codon:yes stop_codon:yes gene_type:complete
MIVQYYKPNSKNTGCAFSFDIGANNKNQEPCVYVRAIKQHSWNSKTRTGSFSENAKNPEKSISIKLNEIEVGGLIFAIEKYDQFSAFHSYEDNKTSISFKPYKKKDGADAFSFGVTRNSANKFGIGVEVSEAYGLREFLKFYLQELYIYRLSKNKSFRDQ